MNTKPNNGDVKPNQQSKASIVKTLLRTRAGASISEIVAATDWQPHSARAFLTSVRKQDPSLIRCKRKDGTTIYRLEREGTARSQRETAAARETAARTL